MSEPKLQLPQVARDRNGDPILPCPTCQSPDAGHHFGPVYYGLKDCGCLDVMAHGGDVRIFGLRCPEHRPKAPRLFGGDGAPLA